MHQTDVQKDADKDTKSEPPVAEGEVDALKELDYRIRNLTKLRIRQLANGGDVCRN